MLLVALSTVIPIAPSSTILKQLPHSSSNIKASVPISSDTMQHPQMYRSVFLVEPRFLLGGLYSNNSSSSSSSSNSKKLRQGCSRYRLVRRLPKHIKCRVRLLWGKVDNNLF
jgi:hypothetical protein